jgi:hypothetical protein
MTTITKIQPKRPKTQTNTTKTAAFLSLCVLICACDSIIGILFALSFNSKMGLDFHRRCAAFLGFTGVALGAFGAHALKATLTEKGTEAAWKTAVAYQLVCSRHANI